MPTDKFAGQDSVTSSITRRFRVPADNETELPFTPKAIMLPAATDLTVGQINNSGSGVTATFTYASGELAVGVWHAERISSISDNTGEVIIGD